MKYKTLSARKDMEAEGEDEIQQESAIMLKWKGAAKRLCDYIKVLKPEIKQTELAKLCNISYTTFQNLSKLKFKDDSNR